MNGHTEDGFKKNDKREATSNEKLNGNSSRDI